MCQFYNILHRPLLNNNFSNLPSLSNNTPTLSNIKPIHYTLYKTPLYYPTNNPPNNRIQGLYATLFHGHPAFLTTTSAPSQQNKMPHQRMDDSWNGTEELLTASNRSRWRLQVIHWISFGHPAALNLQTPSKNIIIFLNPLILLGN